MCKSHRVARPRVEELEPRILYSADLLPAAIDAPAPPAEHRVLDPGGEFATGSGTGAARSAELVFVDAGVVDRETLLSQIRADRPDAQQPEVVVLDGARSGIAQISEALGARRDVAAVHVLAHGTPGALRLGGTTLDLGSLPEHAGQIQGWRASLAPDADLLLYGCDIAAGEQGKALVDALARLSGADVAASEDRTGNPALGGDWELEYLTGQLDAPALLTARTAASWHALLAPPDITSDGGGPTATLAVPENTTAATVVTATGDPGLTFSISGGADAGAFVLDSGSGALSFTLAPDFEAPADGNADNVYDVVVQASDGTLTDTQAIAIAVVNANDAPAIGLPGAGLVYSPDSGARRINPASTVMDIDSANLGGGTLVLAVSGGGTADRLGIRDQGAAPGQIGVSGANVTFGGVLIGSFNGGGDGLTPLIVTLNTSASPSAVQALARNLTYQHMGPAVPGSTRILTLTVSDGSGGTSAPATTQVTLVGAPGGPAESQPAVAPPAAAPAATAPLDPAPAARPGLPQALERSERERADLRTEVAWTLAPVGNGAVEDTSMAPVLAQDIPLASNSSTASAVSAVSSPASPASWGLMPRLSAHFAARPADRAIATQPGADSVPADARRQLDLPWPAGLDLVIGSPVDLPAGDGERIDPVDRQVVNTTGIGIAAASAWWAHQAAGLSGQARPAWQGVDPLVIAGTSPGRAVPAAGPPRPRVAGEEPT